MPQSSSPSMRRRDSQPRHEARWPPDRVALLTRLWCAEDLSASQIGRQLGVTRNAVLGKVHRLGIGKDRPAPVRPAAAAPRVPRPPRRKAVKPQAPMAGDRSAASRRNLAAPWDADAPLASPDAEPADDLPGLVDRLEELRPHACHWPCGDPKADDFAFCGRPARAGPYCSAHAARAFRPGAASAAALLRLAVRLGA